MPYSKLPEKQEYNTIYSAISRDQQGFLSLGTKQSVTSLFSQKRKDLACESSKQKFLSFISAIAWWRLTAAGDECVFLLHPLVSGCLGEVQGVVGMWSPGCTLQIHKPALSCRPIRMALSVCYLLGLAAAVLRD